ncbi:MAG: GEVED domain-containing protein [Caldilineaceae bacterium]
MDHYPRSVPKAQLEISATARQGALIGLLLSLLLGMAAMLALSQAVYAQVAPPPPITITKRASVETTTVSETVTYSITVQNSYTETQLLTMVDALPQGLAYLGDANPVATSGQATFSAANRTVQWGGTLKPGEEATIRFGVIVLEPVEVVKGCGAGNPTGIPDPISNEARAFSNLFPDPIPSQIIIKLLCPDLGDAPDSSNHAGTAMSAYVGITATFPTVFDPATGLPQGPRHAFPRADAWLGAAVSVERDADLLPDQDGVRNIDPVANAPDRDGKDDGLLRLPVKQNCIATTMDVQVTVVGGVAQRYLNAWIDWNHDGDWNDTYTACPGLLTSDWVVRDFVTSLPTGVHTVTVPAFVALDSPNIPDDHWIRITLSDGPAQKDASGNYADGRGPPAGFKFGETEDYIKQLVPPQNEPKLEIRKTANVTQTLPGGIVEFTIQVLNTGTGPATAFSVQDPIPAGMSYVAGTLTSTLPTPNDSNPALMQWTGNIPAGGNVVIKFKAKVSADFQCPGKITNIAKLLAPTGAQVGASEASVTVNCPQGEPKLEMRKFANVTQTGPGGQIEYTIVITNVGTGPANAVNWQDAIPAGTSYVPGTLNATAPTTNDSNPALMKWNGNISAGGAVTIKFKVQVNVPIDCGVVIRNTANIMGASGPVLSASVDVKIVCDAVLTIRKIADVTQTVPGGVIEYTIVVNNSGSGPAAGVSVQDPVPAGTTYVAGSLNATAPTTDDSNPAIMKWNGNIPAGGSVTIKFKVRVNPDFQCPSKVNNVAKLLGPNGQIIGSSDVSVAVLCPGGEPHLEIRKTANVTQTIVGGAIEYTIVVINSGTAPAIGVTVQDPIPAGTSYVAGSLNATSPTPDDSNPAVMKWNGNIPAAGSVTIKFKVLVNADFQCPGKVVNVAQLLHAGAVVPSNEVSIPVFCPQGEPKLEIRKTANVSQTTPGGIIEYTIVIVNSGTAPAINANMQDPIPAGTLYIPGSLIATAPLPDDSNPALMQWTGNVPAGGSVTIKFKVQVAQDYPCEHELVNVAKLLQNGAVLGQANFGVIVHCPQGEPKLTIRKTANVTQTLPGGIIEYTIVVQNSGTGPAIGFSVLDPVPAFTSYVAGSLNATAPATDDSNPAVMKWSGNIPAGGSVTIKFKVMVSQEFQCPGKVNNVARLLDPAGNAIAGAEAVVTVRCPNGEPKLTIRKTANVTQTAPGGEIEYTIVVQNSGSAPAIAVSVVDPIPAFTSYVAGSLNATAPTPDDSNPSLMQWVGNVSAGGTVTIKFKVKVSADITCPSKVLNVARMVGPNGQLLGGAEALVEIICPQQGDPHITLEKHVAVEGQDQPGLDGIILPGTSAVYYLTLSSSDAFTQAVHITDSIPSGLIAVAVSSSSGIATIVDSGHGVVWDGLLGPGTSPVTIKIEVRAEDKLECAQELVNIAHWIVRNSLHEYKGDSNPVILRFACRDLGDAPDSSNHDGVKMTAYVATGVQGNFPTVFDVGLPDRGPRHEFPRPFFLGKGVTPEAEADQGFDADAFNNIIPSSEQSNLDRADDGLDLASVAFKNCQMSQFRVVVTISPAALALLPNKVGYLNVWVDSNRDGDWADSFECPQSATGAAGKAPEHIVIDQVVDVGTLGAGVHVLTINTTSPVSWPDSEAQKPAWLRVTLSEEKSNKPLGGGTYGDGRGYDDHPFRLGETEDYLLRGQEAQPTSDPTVSKHGEIWPDFNPETQERRWVAGWIVNYSNGGSTAASNVHVIDTYAAPQSLIAEHSIPLVPHTHVTPTLDYNVGTLPVGGSGLVIVRTEIPWNTTPGTVITNSAVVNSSNDGNTANNTSVATVTVPILPPLIVSPLAGSTCTGTVEINGVAQPGVSVEVFVDGTSVATVATDGSGNWNTTVSLSNGSHDIYAVATLGALTSAPSPTVTVIVDTTLFWDPISLRFVDDLGHTIIPSGRLDESGWSVFLRPGHTYTVSLHVCCQDAEAQVTMQIGDLTVTLQDLDGDRIYSGSFTIPVGGRLTGAVRICVTCNLIRRCTDGQVTIDPEGTVFDVMTGVPVASASVACLQAGVNAASGDQVFTLWPAADFDQINPQEVDATGYFSFFTPQGTYRLNVNKSGYQSYVSQDLTVVDAPVHQDVPLTPIINKAADQQISVSNSGFEPAVITVEPGTVIEWINSGNEVHSSVSITPSASMPAANGAGVSADSGAWDSGLLQTGESYKRQLDTEGTYTYQDATNPTNSAIVIVKKAEATQKVFLPVVSR